MGESKKELRERQEATIGRIEGIVKRFRWQPPEFHAAMLWNCFTTLSEHFSRNNAVGEINHVVSILESIDKRCGEDKAILDKLKEAITDRDLHRLREIFAKKE